ncbi:MAG: DUF6785 family protein [Thermodesulfobacteriota bacterium]
MTEARISTGETGDRPPKIRLRAIVLGILAAALICLITPFHNIYRQGTPLGGGHFPLAPFLLMFWITILAAGVKKLTRGQDWLTGKELMIVWVLTTLVSGIAYTGLTRTFFINLTAPYYYATIENRWAEILQPLLPSALYPREYAVRPFYEGLAGGRDMGWLSICGQIPWEAWLAPLLLWGGFILTCYGVMICMINLVSRQWLHNERMNLPLLRVPMILAEAFDNNRLGSLLADGFLIAGLAIAAGLHLINGLHVYHPSVPQIPTLILAGAYFPPAGLFDGFQKLTIYIYPAFIGFAFLTSRQISFSFWFFFLAGSLLTGLLLVMGYNIPASALGVTFGPTLTRPEETQMIGAYFIFFLFLVWLGRHHFTEIVSDALHFKTPGPSRTEWFPTSLSFWGLLTGLGVIVLWFCWFGLSLWLSLMVVGVFFMVMLVATRVVCQGGVAYYTLTTSPLDGLTAFGGPRMFSHAGILMAAVTQKVLFVDLRESLMPSLLHAGEVTHREKNRHILLAGIALTLIVGVAVSFLAMLALCYKFGARELELEWATRTTLTVYETIKTAVESPDRTGDWVPFFTSLGAGIMLLLVICYHRAYWWPIHPIGYLTAYSSAMRILWFSFFVGWLCNSLCLRYGGIRLFKRLSLFFVGLIIGDFLMAGIWAVVGLVSGGSYAVLPT